MGIITLTSDWGTSDHYAAVVKGVILQQLPSVTIVDISHAIPAFNLQHASFVVRHAYPSFPAGTVHLIDVSTESPGKGKYCIVSTRGQSFILPDNGLIQLIFAEKPERIIRIDIPGDLKTSTFIGRDLFAQVACRLLEGAGPEEFGSEADPSGQQLPFAPAADQQVIRGKVIYIDAYENVFINITRELFDNIGKGRAFTIYFRTLDYAIQKLSTSYNDVPEGDILALFGSSGLLEIAMNKGNAASLLGLRPDEMVRIEFAD